MASCQFELKAIYSRTQQAAQTLADTTTDADIAYYDEPPVEGRQLEDLLARLDIDAVIVALPITVQPDVIRKALRQSKHVLSEKPIAGDVETAFELISAYERSDHGPIWAVAENFRFLRSVAVAHKALAGFDGEVTGFRVEVLNMIDEDDKFYQTDWFG